MDITLNWSWLKYDIDQETHKAAKCLITQDPSGELQSEAQTADDEFDKDYCKRKITEACALIRDIMHRFSVTVTVFGSHGEQIQVGDDTLLTEAQRWVLTAEHFASRADVQQTLLTSELHKYVVIYVLQDWTKLTHPTLEQNYIARLQAEENRIKSIIYRRKAPSRPA